MSLLRFTVEVDESQNIKIMRPMENNEHHHLSYTDPKSALRIIKMYLYEDLAQSKDERFKSQFDLEAEKAYAEMSERAKAEIDMLKSLHSGGRNNGTR